MNIQNALHLAGLVQLAIAIANFILPGMLQYRSNLGRVSPIIRQIFTVHAAYIVLILLGFSGISIFFADDLCHGQGLGLYLSEFLAVFWVLRVPIQLFYYDPVIKNRYPVGNAVFTTAFLYLGVVFLAAALSKP